MALRDQQSVHNLSTSVFHIFYLFKKKGEKKKEAGWLVAGPVKEVRDMVNDAVARSQNNNIRTSARAGPVVND